MLPALSDARSNRVLPIICALYWLSVETRVQYTAFLLTSKSLNNQPSCRSDLIQLYVPSRQLRSPADTRLLRLSSAHHKSSGRHAFFYQLPLLWDNQPYSLRHSSSTALFRSFLRTHLFSSEH